MLRRSLKRSWPTHWPSLTLPAHIANIDWRFSRLLSFLSLVDKVGLRGNSSGPPMGFGPCSWCMSFTDSRVPPHSASNLHASKGAIFRFKIQIQLVAAGLGFLCEMKSRGLTKYYIFSVQLKRSVFNKKVR